MENSVDKQMETSKKEENIKDKSQVKGEENKPSISQEAKQNDQPKSNPEMKKEDGQEQPLPQKVENTHQENQQEVHLESNQVQQAKEQKQLKNEEKKPEQIKPEIVPDTAMANKQSETKQDIKQEAEPKDLPDNKEDKKQENNQKTEQENQLQTKQNNKQQGKEDVNHQVNSDNKIEQVSANHVQKQNMQEDSKQQEKQQEGDIPFEDYSENQVFHKHQYTYKDGGMNMGVVKDSGSAQAVLNVLKQVGSKIMKGQIPNLNSLSKPIVVCAPITFPETIAQDTYNTHFLDLANQETMPLPRIQLIICHILSSLYRSASILQMKVPIDPTLGETVQLKKKNGTQFCAECIATQPPQCLVQMRGKNKSWEVSYVQHSQATLAIGFNTMYGSNIGRRTIKFADGTIYKTEFPKMSVSGLIIGDRVMNFMETFTVWSEQTKLKGEVKFFSDVDKQQGIGQKVKGWFFSKSKQNQHQRTNGEFDVKISKVTTFDTKDEDYAEATLSLGSGNFVEFLQFDKKVMWKVDDPVEPWEVEDEKKLLQSDSSRRRDIQFMIKNDINNAEKIKLQIEGRDQKDKELRKAMEKLQKQQAQQKKK